MQKRIRNNKGALELSIGTIVILVIGMAMLIMGLVLVRQIFTGGGEAVDLINKNVKAQINKQFNEDQSIKTRVYLPDNQAEVKKSKDYNIAFGIKNIVKGEAQAGTFTYEVKASEVESGCQLTLQQADTYIKLGKIGGQIKILPGDDIKERTIVARAPETSPLCSITYDIIVKKDNQDYDNNFFILKVIG